MNITMRVIIKDKKLVIITEPKTTYFDLPKKVDNILKHEIDFIIKYKWFLSEHTTENEVVRLLCNHKHGNDIHEHEKQ